MVLYSGPMKRTALATLFLVLPAAAFALDFQHGDDEYTDASRFSIAERAAISVLTDIDAISGNPDGSFAAKRTLNRAEFTKIALLAMDVGVGEGDSRNCFPDVPESAWFSRYVCRAEIDGIVQGNPDGLFHAERDVNYAEAAKILVELAGYTLPEPAPNERWAWYTGYLKAAAEHGVELDGVSADQSLTRGQMARFAAAFVAEAAGELDAYRNAERGDFESESSASSSSVSSSSSLSSSSSSSVSSSSSSRSSVALFPAKSSFILAGERSPLILGGTVISTDEASILRFVRFVLRNKVTPIDNVYLVDKDGDVITELKLALNDNDDDDKWEALTPDSTYVFPANESVKVGIAFDMYPFGGGGGSNQLVEVESFQIQTEGQTTGNAKYLFTDNQVYPVHQTSFATLTRAVSTLPMIGTIQAGEQRQIASFRLESDTATGATLSIESVELIMTAANVNVSNVRIGDVAKNSFVDCGLEKLERIYVTCGVLPENLTNVPASGLNVSVYADLAVLGSGNGSLFVEMESRGMIGQPGTFTWSDEIGQFSWIEEDVPFGGNVTWTITK